MSVGSALSHEDQARRMVACARALDGYDLKGIEAGHVREVFAAALKLTAEVERFFALSDRGHVKPLGQCRRAMEDASRRVLDASAALSVPRDVENPKCATTRRPMRNE